MIPDWMTITQYVEGFQSGRCKIEARVKGVVDQYGAPRQDQWQDVANNVPYRFMKLTAKLKDAMIALGQQENLVESYRMSCEVGTPLAVDQRVTTEDGRIWNVVAVEDGLTDAIDAQAAVTRIKRNV